MWTNTFKQSHPQDFYVMGARPNIVEPKNVLTSDEILSGLCYMDVLWFIVTGATFRGLWMSVFICWVVIQHNGAQRNSQIFHYVKDENTTID